jgi:hypothetical protein
MADMSRAKSALPYIQQVFEDDFVQEQLRSAVSGARAAYTRARTQRTQVVQDKGMYRNLRQAATALQRATAALRPAEPEPKHRGRKFATVALAIGATAVVTMKLQQQYDRQRSATAAAPSPSEGAGTTAGTPPAMPIREPAPAGSTG